MSRDPAEFYDYYDDYYDEDAMREEYESEMIDSAIAELPLDNIRWYLGTNGDAVQRRVDSGLKQAEELLGLYYWGPSLACSVTAIELILRFFILRPLVQGAFLSDELSEVLVAKVVTGRTARDRELLPSVANHWDINLEAISLSDGTRLWYRLLSTIWPMRNKFMHMGAAVSKDNAVEGLEIARVLSKDVVVPLARRFGLSWPHTKWHESKGIGDSPRVVFEPGDPFEKRESKAKQK